MRSTRQRAAIADLLAVEDKFRSAHEIYEFLVASGARVGLTTVYRTLQAMAAAGEVDVVHSVEGESCYRQCRTDEHHHHLVCRLCGTTVELPAEEVETWLASVARRHGFADVGHTVELAGTCRDCQPKDNG